jgi:hypothetical protein
MLPFPFPRRRQSMIVVWLLLFGVSSHLQQHYGGYLLVHAQESAAEACTSPSTDAASHSCFNRQLHHLIVLVHGYKGSDKELSYLGKALENVTSYSDDDDADPDLDPDATSSSSHHHYTIYSSATNMGKTHDGVVAGGLRLAAEIEQQLLLRNDEKGKYHTLSIVGNSLGGLYARYALSKLNLKDVQPIVFCTTSTPHLGNTQNTFIKLHSTLEWLIGKYVMEATGEDLFHLTPTVPDMCTLPQFLQPLGKFRQRIAVANAYGTDFLVPVSTAAFLSKSSQVPHHVVESSSTMLSLRYEVLQVTTPSVSNHHHQDSTTTAASHDTNHGHDKADLGASLDALGWTKIFVDIRHVLPNYLHLNVPLISNSNDNKSEQAYYSSQQLLDLLDRKGTLLPLGHPIMMANSRTSWYSWMTSNGRPIMDDLAKRLVSDIERHSREMQEEEKE